MASTTPHRSRDNEVLDLFDYALIRELFGFVLRAPRRRPALAGTVFVLGLLLTAAAFAFMPRVYVSESKILAQRNLVIPLLGNPHRSVPTSFDAPTRDAREIVMGHESLAAIVKDANLVEMWDLQRPPILRVKDRAWAALFGPIADADKERALAGLLEKKLVVNADDTTIRMSIEWHDGQMACDLVTAAQNRFLSWRSSVEVAAIEESIAILDSEVNVQTKAVAAALADVERRTQEIADTSLPTPALPGAPALGSPTRTYITVPRVGGAANAAKIAALLEEKRRAIRELNEPRRKRLAELQAELAEKRATYAPAHPVVVELEAKIREASVVPPAVWQLKLEEAQLVEQVQSAASDSQRSVRSFAPLSPTADAPSAVPAPLDDPLLRVDPPDLAAAKVKLSAALGKFMDIEDRIDAARIELHTSQAAFKYRYMIVVPPEVSRKPESPRPALLIGAGLFLSIFLALFAAAGKDLVSGRFVEVWQVQRKLRIPLLAEVNRP